MLASRPDRLSDRQGNDVAVAQTLQMVKQGTVTSLDNQSVWLGFPSVECLRALYCKAMQSCVIRAVTFL